MPAPMHLLMPLVLVGVEGRSEARAHSFAAEQVRFDLVQSARLQLSTSGGTDSARLSYEPTLLLLSAGSPDSELVLFQDFEGSLVRRYRRGYVGLTQSTTFGRNNLRLSLAPTAGAEGAPATPAPVGAVGPPGGPAQRGPFFDEVVWFGSTTTMLTLGQTWSPSTGFYEYGTYSVQGGLDTGGRQLYPTQQQQSLGGGVTSVLTPRDTLVSGVDLQRTSTSGLGEVHLVAARERWEHVFSPSTRGSVSGGVAHAWEQSEQERRWLPLADGMLSHGWSRQGVRSSLTGAVGLAPVVDWFTGELDHRAYGSVNFTESRRRVRWFGTALGLTSVQPGADGSLTAVVLVVGSAHALNDELSWETNLSSSWQSFAGQEAPPFLWMGTVSLVYRPRPSRL